MVVAISKNQSKKSERDFDKDVNDPYVKAAEAAAYDWFRPRVPTQDFRYLKTWYDFVCTIDGVNRYVDAKCDKYIEDTGNILLENYKIFKDGTKYPGWAYSGLEVVFYVLPYSPGGYLTKVKPFVRYVKKNNHLYEMKYRATKDQPFKPGYTTYFQVVSIPKLEKAGIIEFVPNIELQLYLPEHLKRPKKAA